MTVSVGSSGRAPEASPTPPERRRHRWWRWALGVVVVVMVAGAGAVAYVVFLRDEPEQKSVGEAVDEFRARDEGAAEGVVQPPTRPPAGVYVASGEGQESLSFPPISNSYGAEVPLTVEHLDGGCWLMTVDLNEAHWQSWRFCPGERPTSLVDTGGDTFQRWDLGAMAIENTSTFSCDPPALVFDLEAEAGATWTEACEGTNTEVAGTTTSAGVTTFVGREILKVGDEDVATVHYRQERTLTGAQTGNTVNDWWFAVDDGLPVSSQRTSRVAADSPVGAITYTEEGSWLVRSLDPQR